MIGERNWRTWLYDPAKKSAAPIEGLDWNTGATYVSRLGDQHYVLVPDSGYASTTVVSVSADLSTSARFEMRGWGTRLFQLR